MPGYASIDNDRTIPSWRALVTEIHKYDCRYIIQLHFSGRQRDLPRKEFVDVLAHERHRQTRSPLRTALPGA